MSNDSDDKARENRVREDLKALVSQGTKQSEIALAADVSETTLTQFLRDNAAGYGAKFTNVTTKLERYLASRQERSSLLGGMPSNPDYFATPTSEKIKGVLAYAHIATDIALVLSGPGGGKTETCREYTRRHPNVWNIEFTKSFGRHTVALGYIARHLGIRGAGRTPGEIEDAIVDKVRGTGGLLLCDEAQHLETASIDAIRGIHDKARIGVVFLGNESLYTRLTGGSRSGDNSQITSRIGKRLRVHKPTRGDVEALAEAWGVKQSESLELLYAMSQKPGALRTCTKALRLAHVYAAGKPITPGEIRQGWSDLTTGD